MTATSRLRYAAAILTALAVLLTPSLVAPAGADAKPTVKQLQRRVAVLTISRGAWRATARETARDAKHDQAVLDAQIAALKTTNIGLGGQIATLNGQVADLNGQVAAVAAQRDQALSGLSGAVSVFVANATTSNAVFDTILGPVRAAWTCGGSTFIGTAIISIDINRIGFCD